MNSISIPKKAFKKLFFAFKHYSGGNYIRASILVNSFRKDVKVYYKHINKRLNLTYKDITVIIVVYGKINVGILGKCISSVYSGLPNARIIIVNNGAIGASGLPFVEYKDIVLVNLNCNIFASEARNIGAWVANSEWIYFIDDDAILSFCTDSLMKNKLTLHAARGAVLPKDKNIPPPKHYHLGDSVFPHELNIEGNLLIRRSLFISAGGFDPLMWAHEGKDLSKRCYCIVNKKSIVYTPDMVIKHNPSQGEKLQNKAKRNIQAANYMEVKMDEKIDAIKALFVVFVIDNANLDVYHLESICESYSDVVIDVLFISPSPRKTLDIVNASKIRFRSIVVTESFCTYKPFDEFGYSFLVVMNAKIPLNTSDVREAVSKSLAEGRSLRVCNAWVAAVDRFGVDTCKISSKLLELIKAYKSMEHVVEKPSIMKIAYPNSCVKEEIIFISFYTTDNYYSTKADELRHCLDVLGLAYDIVPFVVPLGTVWPDICRKKVSIYFDLFKKHKDNYKKVVWIDVDCKINFLPSFILDFDVDFMAFRRGFPSNLDAERNLTRHWEPCFFVFKSNSVCFDMLQYASQIESSSPDIKATDDYFFEEAWRKYAPNLTAFEMPGQMSSRGNKLVFNAVEARKHGVFFSFGDSGNVVKFKGKVVQHEKMIKPHVTKINVDLRNTSTLAILIKEAKKKKSVLCDPNHTYARGINENDRELVKSLYNYEIGGPSIKLNWWIRPSPGNMGDWLSPYIINKVTGCSVSYAPSEHSKVISLGSIGRYITDHHTVWGTGISSAETELSKSARYIAVRGPYTALALKNSGGKPPKVFGDPAIIMPDIYKSSRLPGNDYALVRHFVHQNCDLVVDEGVRDINILISSPRDLECFIDQLHECRAIVTTSLHVLILCISYRIPCRLITISEKDRCVSGDGVKYKDFYEGVGIPPKTHVNFHNAITRSSIESVVLDDSIDLSIIEQLRSALLSDFAVNSCLYI